MLRPEIKYTQKQKNTEIGLTISNRIKNSVAGQFDFQRDYFRDDQKNRMNVL